MSDEIPDWVAQLGQVLSGLADLAKVIGTYYRGLIAEGFTPDQALSLTLAFQVQMQQARPE